MMLQEVAASRRESFTRRHPLWAPLVGLAALAALAVVTRPPLPVDETRYLSVAWEMWRGGDLVVPHLNGLPYADKPPLLFWAIHFGWALFGVTEWWPRLVPAFFGMGALALVAAIGRRVGLGASAVRTVPWILAGFLPWAVFSVALMFDLVLSFFVVLGVLGLVRAVRGERWGWTLVALAVGCGILTKGPVVLLHLAGPALLAPWWGRELRTGAFGARWYGAFAAALCGGLAIAAAWAVPAALHGGEPYRQAIFVDQTAGRMVQSFAHRRPWYWYFPLLPGLLFPYFFWPPLWRGLRAARGALATPVLRLAAAWALPPFLAFLLISGKQPHYLLPLLPPAALAIAHLLTLVAPARRRDWLGPWLPAAAIPVALVILAELGGRPGVPPWAGQLAPGAAVVTLLALAAVAVFLARDPERAGARLGLVTVVLVAGLLVCFSPVVTAAYDVRPAALYLKVLERQGRPLARMRQDDGEFNFTGRLARPLEVIPTGTADAWFAAHPGGAVIEEVRELLPPERLVGASLVLPYRTKQLVIWEAPAPGTATSSR